MNMEWALPTPEETEEAISINETSVEIETNSTMEEVVAVAEQGDNSVPNEVKDPRTFSLQPLCEAYKLAGGVSPQQREISTQARVLESAVRDSEERVEVGAPLTESEEQAKPESLQAGFQRTAEVLQNALDTSALYLQREGNLTLSSQNSVNISSLKGATITGANTFLSTATTIINSQVSANASESTINLTDFSITRVNGSSTTHVEDTNQLTTSNDIRRASETSQVIANRTYNHGIELNSATGNTVLSTAGSGGHTIHSKGNVSTFTDSSSITLATEQVTVGAGSPSSTGPTPQAEPDFSALSHIPDAASFVRIIAGDSPGITSVTSGDSSSVSKGSQLTSASNTYLSAAKTAAQVAGRELMNGVLNPGGNPQSHVFHQRKTIIQGRLIGGFPSLDIDALLFPTVPPLPPKPTAYTIEDLQACIPNSYKGAESSIGDTLTEAAREVAESLGVDIETIRRSAGSQSTGNNTSDVVPGETGTEQDIATTNSEMSESPNMVSVATGIAQMIPATSSGGGPTNVYIDIYGESSSESQGEIGSTAEEEEDSTIESVIQEIEAKVDHPQSEVAIFIARDLYEQGYRGSEDRENLIKGTLEALREEGLKGDRKLITKVMDLMRDSFSQVAMGMFQDLGDYPSISLPQIGSVGQVIGKSFGLEDLGSIVDSLTDIGSLEGLSSGALLDNLGLGDIDFSSIGSVDDLISIVGDNEIAEILKRESIKKAIERVLGSEAATSIVPIIEQVLNGPTLDMEAVNDLIGTTLSIEGIIDALPGDYLDRLKPVLSSVLEGGELNLSNEDVIGVLSSIAGNDTPFKILSSYREIESIIGNVRALSSVPDLLNLMEDNDVPIISRASLLLSCLDVFNRVKSIMGSFESVFNSLGDISFDGLSKSDEEIVKSAADNLVRQESLIEEHNREDYSGEQPVQRLSDSTDRRILILGIGRVVETQVIERGDKFYTPPSLDGVIIKEDGLYTTEQKVEVGTTPNANTSEVDATLANTSEVGTTLDNSTSKTQAIITRPYQGPFLLKEEVAQIREGEVVIWSNPDWDVREEDQGLIVEKSINSPKTPPHYYIPYKPYTRKNYEDRGQLSRTSRFIESIPKLIQFINLVNKSSYQDIKSITNLGASRSEADYLTLLKASSGKRIEEVESKVCFPVTKLDPYESEIEVVSISAEGYITFRSISRNVVGINSSIQIRSESYVKANGKSLSVEFSERYYNPIYLNYRVRDFDPTTKLGVAYIETKQRLMLKDSEGVLYKYYTSDIGKKIYPSIEDSYLL